MVNDLSNTDPKTAKFIACRKYGVPLVQSYAQDPTSIGNALLNLGTQILRSNLPADKANPSTNILNNPVQLAVTTIKAPKNLVSQTSEVV